MAGVSFFERMSGQLLDSRGEQHPASFEIKAEASHLAHFLRHGKTRISGVIDAQPWADAAALSGTLELSPLVHRRIVYDFAFSDAEGQPCRFVGKKKLRLGRPLHSLTHLSAELRCRAALVAKGQMRFDLRELPAFARSWSSQSSFIAPPIHRLLPGQRAPFAREMDAKAAVLLHTLADALFEPGEHVVGFDREARALLQQQLQSMPTRLLRLYEQALRWLDVMAVVGHGRTFGGLDRARRQRLLEALAAGPAGDTLPGSRTVLRYLTAPLRLAQFSDPRYLRSLGYPQPEPLSQPEPTPRHAQRVTEAEALPTTHDVHAEVVVVGTGAGGAALAAELAQRGVAVVLLEEGRYFSRAAFNKDIPTRMRSIWRQRGMTFTVGKPPIIVPLGRAVGGTTTINSGTCFRAPDAILQDWRRAGFPEDFAPDRLAPYYDRVAAELSVAPNAPRYLGRIADVVARGADALSLEHGPLPRNAPDCDGQGQCIYGCPTGAKRSTDVSYVPRALRAGAELFVGLPVRRILMRDGRALGVEARGADRHGAPKTLRVFADQVVISAGAVLSPLLLRQNGLRLPQLGQNLSLHPGMGMLALCDGPMSPWNAVPQGYGVRGYEQEGICFEGFYLPPGGASLLMPFVGQQLTQWMDRFDHLGQFGFMVRDDSVGHVQRDSYGQPVIRYSLSDRTLVQLQKGAAILAELLLRGGARAVVAGVGGRDVIRTVEQARALASARLTAFEFNLLGAHPLGTCRIGANARDAVVDYEHRVFGTDNLYVVDGGAVPTALGVNPQMTIMALATRAAEIIAARQS